MTPLWLSLTEFASRFPDRSSIRAKTYSGEGLAVVGVSLDEEGWKVLKPFLAEHPVSYRVALGNEDVAKQYGIEGMPDTFLIDRHGRIAAA
jgi:hypothetical protein